MNVLISVCICTYKRPAMLSRLLESLQKQITKDKFEFSILIIDNDNEQSAKEIYTKYRKTSVVKMIYYNVPEKNFALVRNAALTNADGNFVAFIDDDEFPVDSWLMDHFETIRKYDADGSLGPVIPYFIIKPPDWIIKSGLCERKRFDTGTILSWHNTRTGNVLFKKSIIKDTSDFFDLNFGKLGGEDVDFFRRHIFKGEKFVFCDEAMVYEEVPVERMDLSYFTKRARLRGVISYNYYSNVMNFALKMKMLVKASSAIAIYLFLLPFLRIAGFHHFAKFFIKINDHFGRVKAILGFSKNIKRDI